MEGGRRLLTEVQLVKLMDQFKKREEVIVSLEAALEASLGRESVLEELQASTHQSLSGMNEQVTTIFSTLAGVEMKSKQVGTCHRMLCVVIEVGRRG